jgi:hypothetical protein
MEHGSFQPPTLVRFGITHGDVILACPWNVEACCCQLRQHLVAVGDEAFAHVLHDPIVNLFSGIATPDALKQALDLTSPLGCLRIIPIELFVQDIAQGVIGSLVARWSDIEATAISEFLARRYEVQFHTALVGMPDPQNISIVLVQPGEGQLLEGIHDRFLLIR